MKAARTSETIKVASSNLEYHDFGSVAELTEYCAKQERDTRNLDHTSSERGSNSFCDGDTYTEAIGKTESGCPETLKAVELAVENIRAITAPEQTSAWVTSREVIGDCWDMGAVIAGVPECAISTHPYERREDSTIQRDKVLTIALGVCVSAIVTPAAIQRRGAALVALVDALEHFGIRCEVRVEIGSDWKVGSKGKNGAGFSLMSLLLKEADQPLEISRLSYCVAHAGFFRRVGFAWMERLQDVTVTYGYGKPCDIRKHFGDEACEDAGIAKVDVNFAADKGSYLNNMSAADWQKYIAKILDERGIEIETA
jgi:hypothetical protein